MKEYEEVLRKLRRMIEDTASDVGAVKWAFIESIDMLSNLRDMLHGQERDYAEKVIKTFGAIGDAAIKASETANQTKGFVNEVYDEL
jgi:hypothetical protein